MENTNPRQQRGEELAKQNGTIKRLDENTYKVKSQTTYNKTYDVIRTKSGFICTCADYRFRKICCKHIHAVEFSIRFRQKVREENSVIIEQVELSKCPNCASKDFIRKGRRHNKYGDMQRYACKNCGKWFNFNLGFERMRANPQTITSAMQLYFTGESLRNVQKFLRLQGVEVSHQTIYNWIKKYTNLMKSYLDKIVPQVGDVWRADEVYVKIKGDMKYLFALLDDETRFWISQEVADSKHKHNPYMLFRNGKETTQTRPRVLITDGLRVYENAYRKEFRTQNLEKRTTHVRHIRFQGDMNNNKMERFNGEFRDREKIVRGLKKTDSVMFDGYQLYHNYVRPHMSLDNQTPADKAGIKIKGKNKWITLIQNASRR